MATAGKHSFQSGLTGSKLDMLENPKIFAFPGDTTILQTCPRVLSAFSSVYQHEQNYISTRYLSQRHQEAIAGTRGWANPPPRKGMERLSCLQQSATHAHPPPKLTTVPRFCPAAVSKRALGKQRSRLAVVARLLVGIQHTRPRMRPPAAA